MDTQYQEIPKFIDLTNLERNLTEADLIALCDKANNPIAKVAAVCIEKEYVAFCKQYLSNTDIKIASVYNFPFGDESLNKIKEDIYCSLEEHVDELDIVIPIQKLQKTSNLSHFYDIIFNFVCEIRSAVPQNLLKFIISTDILQDKALITLAAKGVIAGGGDFVKTSTGKVKEGGVTLLQIQTVLEAIQTYKKQVGFKASGGVREPNFAIDIYHEAQKVYLDKISPANFRIGASKLLDLLLA